MFSLFGHLFGRIPLFPYPGLPVSLAVKMSFHEAAFGKEKLWLPGETHSLGQVLRYLVFSHAVTCPFFVTKHN